MQAENYRIGCVGRTGQCWGTACRSRRNACDSYRVSIKWCAPIASVAALSERLVHLQISMHSADRTGSQICHCEAPKGPRQSRGGSYDFAEAALLSDWALRDSHVASLLGMTIRGHSPF